MSKREASDAIKDRGGKHMRTGVPANGAGAGAADVSGERVVLGGGALDVVAGVCALDRTHRASPRGKVSLIRCQELCSAPLPLPGGRLCYRTLTDREAKLLWDKESPPRNFLFIKKWKQPDVTAAAFELATWLLKQADVQVWMKIDDGEVLAPGLLPHTPECQDSIDVVVCLGGDGTVLYVSSLFPGSMPPVMSISHGSLGFLTSFDWSDAKDGLLKVLNGHNEPLPFTTRSRLQIDMYSSGSKLPTATYQAMNELSVERGPSTFMASLEAFVDDDPVTLVQADGILVASPTGSTAYSLSAGGPILFPTIPGIVFTPICPHSLSFRPILFPDSSHITLQVPAEARASAWASVDGRNQTELKAGDKVVASTSKFPMPIISFRSAARDFFEHLNTKLHWNLREVQKPLTKL